MEKKKKKKESNSAVPRRAQASVASPASHKAGKQQFKLGGNLHQLFQFKLLCTVCYRYIYHQVVVNNDNNNNIIEIIIKLYY